MFDNLIGLGYGILVFAIIVGVGTVVLYNFGGAVATCDTSTCGSSYFFNTSDSTCWNSTATCDATPSGSGYTNTNYLLTQLGSSGLAGWTPAIIAISVGLMFLGAFMVKGGKKKGRY